MKPKQPLGFYALYALIWAYGMSLHQEYLRDGMDMNIFTSSDFVFLIISWILLFHFLYKRWLSERQGLPEPSFWES